MTTVFFSNVARLPARFCPPAAPRFLFSTGLFEAQEYSV